MAPRPGRAWLSTFSPMFLPKHAPKSKNLTQAQQGAKWTLVPSKNAPSSVPAEHVRAESFRIPTRIYCGLTIVGWICSEIRSGEFIGSRIYWLTSRFIAPRITILLTMHG